MPVIITQNEKNALKGTVGVPSGNNRFVTESDSRNNNARIPLTHGHNYTALNVGALASTAFQGLKKITVGITQPISPDIGDLWVDTN